MSVAVRSSLAAGWLLLLAGAGTVVAFHHEHDRFQAMETGPALAPRFYHAAPARPLGRRQAQCNRGNHPCNEIGDVGSTACCPDDSYCIVNPTATTRAACCPIGSTCGSSCSEKEYQCAVTVTSTVDGSVTTSVASACCPRACTSTSMFGCASSLGGGCCSYGSVCGTNVCLSTLSASVSSSALVSQVPAGCTTSQITCAVSLGGGCCAVTQSCTLVGGAAHCADTIVTPTASGVTRMDEQAGELGAGAKAGISVGVVVGAGLVIGAITWLCVRKRRARRRAEAGSSDRPRPTGVIGAVLGSGRDRDVSDDTSEMVSHGPVPGVTQEYFGGDPAIGPYSDFQNPPSGGTTPGVDRGGVPLAPHGPGDIAVPVEIDSQTSQLGGGAPRESTSYAPSRTSIPPPPPPATETVNGRFELYGSELLDPMINMPSPITPVAPSPLDETPQSEVSEEPKGTLGR